MLLALPWTLPYWWDPMRMDRYFEGSLPPLEEPLRRAGAFLRERTGPHDVLAGDPHFARWAAALAGRRSLMSAAIPPANDHAQRLEVLRTLVVSRDAESVRTAAAVYGITHLVVTPLVLSSYGTTLEDLDDRPLLYKVCHTERREDGILAIYRIIDPHSRSAGKVTGVP
jgi:hypothetical protein